MHRSDRGSINRFAAKLSSAILKSRCVCDAGIMSTNACQILFHQFQENYKKKELISNEENLVL